MISLISSEINFFSDRLCTAVATPVELKIALLLLPPAVARLLLRKLNVLNQTPHIHQPPT